MMSRFLQDAVLELLRREMARHIDNGLDYDDALNLGLAEVQRQTRESNLFLQSHLISEAVDRIEGYTRACGTSLH